MVNSLGAPRLQRQGEAQQKEDEAVAEDDHDFIGAEKLPYRGHRRRCRTTFHQYIVPSVRPGVPKEPASRAPPRRPEPTPGRAHV